PSAECDGQHALFRVTGNQICHLLARHRWRDGIVLQALARPDVLTAPRVIGHNCFLTRGNYLLTTGGLHHNGRGPASAYFARRFPHFLSGFLIASTAEGTTAS